MTLQTVRGLILLSFVCTALNAAPQFVPLFDGKTLKGWHKIGTGEWRIEKGAIQGLHRRTQIRYGHLVSDKTYTNFTIRLEYKSVKGNSGLYVRADEAGWSGISGFQAEIDPDKDTGGLYETNGRGWVVKPKEEDVKKWYKPNEWNTMVVSAKGKDITVEVNGHKTAEVKNDKGRTFGKIALQLHGTQEVEVWFRNIEIAEE